jgi:predicted nucleic-acid-binding protein
VIVLDTNIVVRLIVADNPEQTDLAEKLLRREEANVPLTVILETAWVLRRGYKLSRAVVVSSLRALAGLATVHIEDEAAVRQAIDWHEAGLDFADALHLASLARGDSFVTFDRDLIRRASRLQVAPAVQTP